MHAQAAQVVNDAARRGDAGVGPPRRPGAAFTIVKRVIDVASALALLVVTGPVLAVCAGWVWLMDGRPVLYRQWRVGRGGWLFEVYKLRTMSADAEGDGQARFAQSRDPRVLPGCGWMRRSHVDELPQLWNVLMGQMSLVGPRPERPEMIEHLRPHLPGIDRRLAVRPGITGLAQVRNGYTNDVAGARKKLAYDLQYLRRLNLGTELRLMFATVPKLWDRASL